MALDAAVKILTLKNDRQLGKRLPNGVLTVALGIPSLWTLVLGRVVALPSTGRHPVHFGVPVRTEASPNAVPTNSSVPEDPTSPTAGL